MYTFIGTLSTLSPFDLYSCRPLPLFLFLSFSTRLPYFSLPPCRSPLGLPTCLHTSLSIYLLSVCVSVCVSVCLFHSLPLLL